MDVVRLTPLSKAARAELALLRAHNGGTLPTSRQIVDWAKAHPDSALQQGFEWDIFKAVEVARREWVAADSTKGQSFNKRTLGVAKVTT